MYIHTTARACRQSTIDAKIRCSSIKLQSKEQASQRTPLHKAKWVLDAALHNMARVDAAISYATPHVLSPHFEKVSSGMCSKSQFLGGTGTKPQHDPHDWCSDLVSAYSLFLSVAGSKIGSKIG